jgi:hypothetical protein
MTSIVHSFLSKSVPYFQEPSLRFTRHHAPTLMSAISLGLSLELSKSSSLVLVSSSRELLPPLASALEPPPPPLDPQSSSSPPFAPLAYIDHSRCKEMLIISCVHSLPWPYLHFVS